MSNVVELNRPSRVDNGMLVQVAAALRTLWLSRNIDTSGYFLGMNLLARMQEAQQYQVCASPREIAGEVVRSGNGYVSGHSFRDLREFIGAAQSVHKHVFLLSDFRLSELQRPDARERHFTRAPDLHAHVDFDVDTPIWFKLDVENFDEMCMHMDEIKGDFEEITTNVRQLEFK